MKAHSVETKPSTDDSPLTKGEARKKELIEAAIDVLAADGLSGTTLAAVADRCGVTPALINVHFRNKDGLLSEVLRQLSDEYHRVWRQALADAGPRAADRLWLLVEADFDETFCTPRNMRAWRAFWSESSWQKHYYDTHGSSTSESSNVLVELCRQLVAEGVYGDLDPEIAALQIDVLSGGLWSGVTSNFDPISIDIARRVARQNLVLLFPKHYTDEGPR